MKKSFFTLGKMFCGIVPMDGEIGNNDVLETGLSPCINIHFAYRLMGVELLAICPSWLF
ncbi:MAG: hypothetical protein LKG25_06360 [Prevotella sp.]|jgi:hypothetical protein|nr:hypothetical protein [Prevotella sp.]MCI1282203.1 hypothetical protein [Prevotella sp.]